MLPEYFHNRFFTKKQATENRITLTEIFRIKRELNRKINANN